MVRVLNRRRLGKVLPPNAVYVGRPTPFGNPFAIGQDGTRDEVVSKYMSWLFASEQKLLRAAARNQLRGHDLVCWCAPLRCHADVLAEFVNMEETE